MMTVEEMVKALLWKELESLSYSGFEVGDSDIIKAWEVIEGQIDRSQLTPGSNNPGMMAVSEIIDDYIMVFRHGFYEGRSEIGGENATDRNMEEADIEKEGLEKFLGDLCLVLYRDAEMYKKVSYNEIVGKARSNNAEIGSSRNAWHMKAEKRAEERDQYKALADFHQKRYCWNENCDKRFSEELGNKPSSVDNPKDSE